MSVIEFARDAQDFCVNRLFAGTANVSKPPDGTSERPQFGKGLPHSRNEAHSLIPQHEWEWWTCSSTIGITGLDANNFCLSRECSMKLC